MPLYEYTCAECGEQYEILQKINEPNPKSCPNCKRPGLYRAVSNFGTKLPGLESRQEFSGGQRQRIAIARALAASPEMLVADEPVSALDVSIQAQILNLLKQLRKERNLTLLFISHDLAVVDQLCDRIFVLYRGRLMEELQKKQLDQARHPYTRLLLDSLPSYAKRETGLPIAPVEAEDAYIKGCPFVNRCSESQAVCYQRVPQWSSLSKGHWAACHAVKPS